MIIDSSTLDSTSAYKLLIGSSLPRPIGWVSTQSSNGVANLAPISFFTAVGRKPPMVSLSLQPRANGVTLKDTFVNIRDTEEFVVNLATLPLAHALHRTAFEFASADALCVDLPGMGNRTGELGPHTLDRFAEAVAMQVRALARPIILVGQSMGA